MRQLMLTAREFDGFVFPVVTQGNGAQNDGEWETAIRLVRALKEPSLAEDKPYNETEKKAIADGALLIKSKVLIEDSAVFLLEEDAITLLERRLRENRKGVPFGVAEDYEALIQKVHNAPVAPVEVKA